MSSCLSFPNVPTNIFAGIHYFLALPEGSERDTIHQLLQHGGATLEFFFTPTLTNLVISKNIFFAEYVLCQNAIPTTPYSLSPANIPLPIVHPEWIVHSVMLQTVISIDSHYMVKSTPSLFDALTFCLDDDADGPRIHRLADQINQSTTGRAFLRSSLSPAQPISFFISSCPDGDFHILSQKLSPRPLLHPEWLEHILQSSVSSSLPLPPTFPYELLPLPLDKRTVSSTHQTSSFLTQFKKACQDTKIRHLFQNLTFVFDKSIDESTDDRQQKEVLTKRIISCGGQVLEECNESLDTVYYISQYQNNFIFHHCEQQNPRPRFHFVTSHYIRDCLLSVSLLPFRLLSRPFPRNPISGASRLKIAVSGYAGRVRADLYDMIVLIGAQLSLQFTPDCTHLISAHRSGDKYVYALKHHISVLNHRWIEDCILQWQLLPTTREEEVEETNTPLQSNTLPIEADTLTNDTPSSSCALQIIERRYMSRMQERYVMFCPDVLHEEFGTRTVANLIDGRKDPVEREMEGKENVDTPKRNKVKHRSLRTVENQALSSQRSSPNRRDIPSPVTKQSLSARKPSQLQTPSFTVTDITPRIVFTNVSDAQQYHQGIWKLQGTLASSVRGCTHLVTTVPLTRTAKLLAGICVAPHLVTLDWLEESLRVGHFVSEQAYVPQDVVFEDTYHVDMRALLLSPSRKIPSQLFSKYLFYATPSISPDATTLQSLLQLTGGSLIQRPPLSNGKPVVSSLIVISCEKDQHMLAPFKECRVPCYMPEFILSSILHQKILFDQHSL